MLQQFAGNTGHTRIPRLTPRFYTGPNLIYKRKLDKLTNIIVLVRSLSCYEIASRATTGFPNKGLPIQIILPVMCRLPVGGINYKLVNAGHY